MQDLNDLLFFAKVVEHGGFNAASRQLGIPKSRLSRRVAELESRLGVRLMQRTTRRLALTEVGAQYYQHCQAMLAEAEAAAETIARHTAEPRGLVRVSCPELLRRWPAAPGGGHQSGAAPRPGARPRCSAPTAMHRCRCRSRCPAPGA